jgi:hypothetical protein
MADLLLEGKDVTDTAIDGVSNPRKSLIAKSNDGIEALVCRNAQEKLGGIASAKHLVNGSKVSSALLRVKIGSRTYASGTCRRHKAHLRCLHSLLSLSPLPQKSASF